MGWGGFGSNGSVHWQINYKDVGPAAHVDFDDTKKHPGSRVKCSAIGGQGHQGKFRVTTRYGSHARAVEALQRALTRLQRDGGSVAHVDVDVRPYDRVKNRPGAPKNWEIIVRW